MNKNILIGILIVALIAVLLFVIFAGDETEEPVPEEDQPLEEIDESEESEDEEEEEEEEADFSERLEETVEGFVGKPYKQGPLDVDSSEEEILYTEEGFDSTTLVLSVAAKVHSEENPEEAMKEIHYYPPGEVSYENRLHFSSYRNKVSDYFEDITAEVGGDLTKSREVVLNKYRQGEGRWINIDWQEEIVIDYIPRQRVSEVVDDLPEVVGVGFVQEDLFETGLDVTHEGFVLDGTNLVHASSEKGRVVEESFLGYLERQGHSGVLFYEIK